MDERENPSSDTPTGDLDPYDIDMDNAAAVPVRKTWLTYTRGALAGGALAFVSGLLVVFIWDIVMVLIDFGEFAWLWEWRFSLFFYYQKVPLESQIAGEGIGSSTELFVCVLTIVGIVLFIMMFLSGRLAAKISKPQTVKEALLTGASISVPYTLACLALYPLARCTGDAYAVDITKPVLLPAIILCFLWSCLFGAWGGMRQFGGRAPLRKWLHEKASKSSERVAALILGLRNTVRIILLASIAGFIFFIVMAFETGIPNRYDISTLINESPGMSAIAFSSAMGVPVEGDRFDWMYGSPFEYIDHNLAYGDFEGMRMQEGFRAGLADIFFFMGTLAVFIYGSWWLIRHHGSARISDFVLSLLFCSVLFPVCMLILSSGHAESIYAFLLHGLNYKNLNSELLVLFGFAWTIVIGFVSFGMYRGYRKLSPSARRSLQEYQERSNSGIKG